MEYVFNLIQKDKSWRLNKKDRSVLAHRPFSRVEQSYEEEAKKYFPDDELLASIHTAIALGVPLLITGEAGTGKTMAAYYAAYKLELEPVLLFQVKSDSTARDLLYHFDTIRYFHDANIKTKGDKAELDKNEYIEPKVLYTAFTSAKELGFPRVVLIDEIDKAPRDFPNDLLYELDQMEFTINETDEKIQCPDNLRPIVFITSNSERLLPEPFLRRCVYHHIEFNEDLIQKVVELRKNEFGLDDTFLKLAIERFLSLRKLTLRKKPATGELILWLRALGLTVDKYTKDLDENLKKLDHLGCLIKDRNDFDELPGIR